MNAILKKTCPRQFSTLINDLDLREIELHETSKRTHFMEQAAVSVGLLLHMKVLNKSLSC